MIKQKIEEINILISYFAYILNMMKEEIGSENISLMEVGNGWTCTPKIKHVRQSEIQKSKTHIFEGLFKPS